MYLSLLSIFSALAAVSLAANPNPFDIPPQGLSFTAGQPTTLKWTPTTSGTVTLRLRQGASSDLEAGTVIQANIPNSGSYTYTPPASTVRGSDYSIEIQSDSDPTQANYSPYFVIDSSNTVASATSASASGTPSSSASPSASPSASTSSAAATSAMRSSSTSGSATSTKTSNSAQSTSAMVKSTVTSKSSSSSTKASTSASPAATSAPASAPASGGNRAAVSRYYIGVLAIMVAPIFAW